MDSGRLRKRNTTQTSPLSSIQSPVVNGDNALVSETLTKSKKVNDSLNGGGLGQNPWLYRITVMCHVIAIAIYIYGVILRVTVLHTGVECDMTYSMRQFLEVSTPYSKSDTLPRVSKDYKLFKFVDSRDPRYQRILRQDGPLEGNEHCGRLSVSSNSNRRNNTQSTIVLYIPGHWGSYGQSRSVGAHGIQLTGRQMDRHRVHNVQTALSRGMWNGDANDQLEAFVYEVYAVDFSEQGGALHGRFLEHQSDFVASVALQLTETCGVDSITLMAHSMGGYVARLAAIRHPNVRRLISNVVTLATPHSSPLYAFDWSVHRVYRQLQAERDTHAAIVSISGGARDEMIAPEACMADHSSSLSYLSSEWTIERGGLGMDHRAVVWCHSVLEHVRQSIWALAKSKSTASVEERLGNVEQLLGKKSYTESLQLLASNLHSKFGSWRVLAMQSAMIYNTPIMYGMYAMFGSLRIGLPDQASSPLMLLSAVLVGAVWSDVSIPIVIVLCLVANAIQVLLIHVILLMSRWRMRGSPAVSLAIAYFVLPGGLLLGTGVASYHFRLFQWSWQILGCFLFAYGILMLYSSLLLLVIEDRNPSRRIHNATLVSLVGLTAPGIFAGSVTLMVWEQGVSEVSSWCLVVLLAIPTAGLACSRCIDGAELLEAGSQPRLRSMLVLGVSLSLSPWVVSRGHAFVVAFLTGATVAVEAGAELLLHVLPQMKVRREGAKPCSRSTS